MENTQMNALIVRYTDAMLAYYGVLKVDQFTVMLQELMNSELTAAELKALVVKNKEKFKKTEIVGDYIYYSICEEYQAVYEDAQQAEQLDYPKITAEDCESYHIRGIIWSDAHEKFAKLSKETFGVTDMVEVYDFIDTITIMFNYYYETADIIAEIFADSEKPQAKVKKKYHRAIVELYNKSPLWIYKGNTPKSAALSKVLPFVQTEKIGRNDPCPCGSGKKYKKCCMNKSKDQF